MIKSINLKNYIETLESGKRPKGGASNSGVPSLGGEHINLNGGFNLQIDKLKFVPEEYFNSLSKGIIKKNDILIVKDGATTGKVAYVNEDFSLEKACINEHVFLVRPKKEINPKYLFYYFFSNIGQREILKDFRGATVGGISKEFIDIDMYIPKVDEQIEIIKILDKAKRLIDKRKEQIKALDELVKSQFIEMFGDPVQNPLGWQLKPFLDSGNCKNGMNFSATETGVELQYLGVGDFKDLSKIEDVNNLGKVSLNKMPSTEYLLQDGDIVFVRSNGNKALVGRCLAVYPNGIPTTYSGFCIRYRKTDKSLEIPYLLQVLKTDSMRKNMAGRGANIQNLNQQILGELMIPIPPIELQNQFADFVKQVDKLKFEMEKSLKELEDNFNSLMQKAFKGELFN